MPRPTRRRGAAPIPPRPPAELHRQYVDERRSLDDLGARYHVSGWTVKRWLRKAGIRRRPARWALTVTAADLRALYVQQELTIGEIAALKQVSPNTVWHALKHHQIPRRPAARRAGPPPEVAELRRLYLKEGW